MTDTLAFAGGFQEPVFEAQAVFRSLMDCMARPGTIGHVAASVLPPKPLSPAAGAVALTLCDHDTPVWLTPSGWRGRFPISICTIPGRYRPRRRSSWPASARRRRWRWTRAFAIPRAAASRPTLVLACTAIRTVFAAAIQPLGIR